MNFLFLFAHQDDEFAVLQLISNALSDGHNVFCVYLTTGAFTGKCFENRNQESLAVLAKIGVLPRNIFFAGQELNIPDGGLPDRMEIAAEWLNNWISNHDRLSGLFVPAWEGGHHDHDAVHAIGALLGKRYCMQDNTWQFPLYNGYNCRGPFFRVLLPLELNGPIKSVPIPWIHRFRFLRYCLSYPSQVTTWIGLFPFVCLHYFLVGTESIQLVSLDRLQESPHSGKLYYERRFNYKLDQMINNINSLMLKYK